MTPVAWAVLGLAVLLLIWPFLIYPALLGLLPERPVARAVDGAPLPGSALLFCAYNEAAALPAKIANLRALKERYPDLSIAAYDDGSTDATGALLDAASDIVRVVHGPGRAGKARGMKTLVAQAEADVLIFTDANVLLDVAAIDRLLRYYADPDVGGVLGSLVYDGADASASAQVGGLYWRIEEMLKDRESRTGNVMGADGSIFSIARDLYPDFPDHVLDDLTVSMAVVFAGRRLIKARDVVAREMMVAARADEQRRKIRIAARAWTTHRHLAPQLRRMAAIDRFKYASRKLVRWFGAVWMAMGGLAALWIGWTAGPVFAMLLVLSGAGIVTAGLLSQRGPLAALADVVIAYVSTLRGIVLAMAGRDFTLWAPAPSRMKGSDRT